LHVNIIAMLLYISWKKIVYMVRLNMMDALCYQHECSCMHELYDIMVIVKRVFYFLYKL